MPRLSLYKPERGQDYKFMDRQISEMFQAGGTDVYLHKYLGPKLNPNGTADQPVIDSYNVANIQDLLFLENRDRSYDPDIYRLRGHYNVQNLDFDLSQFGLFLNNDIVFITIHYNDMIDLLGRKLIVGDVIELPHMLDYNPLEETIPVALKRFMQVTDGNYASEGFSPTWFPHLWRIKCEPLVDSEEFSQILDAPINMDNYLGIWDSTKVYTAGYVISYGDKNYISKIDVPIGITPPNALYWELDTADNLKDILATYNKNISVNNAALNEAARILPKTGYDTSDLYIVPTYGEFSENGIFSRKLRQPAPPIDVNTTSSGAPVVVSGTIQMRRNPNYKNASPVIRISKTALKSIWDMTADMNSDAIDAFVTMSLESMELPAEVIGSGSGPISGDKILVARSQGVITGPYGTADNTYATADQNPTLTGFTGTISTQMNFRADCDPAYQYISRASPRSFGYSAGYMSGSGEAPNGFPTGAGISFPANPQVGDYFLRIDYLPQLLYRWDGALWIRISANVRTQTGYTASDQSLQSQFINNTAQTQLTDGTFVSQSQPLSSILQLSPDPILPI